MRRHVGDGERQPAISCLSVQPKEALLDPEPLTRQRVPSPQLDVCMAECCMPMVAIHVHSAPLTQSLLLHACKGNYEWLLSPPLCCLRRRVPECAVAGDPARHSVRQ